MTTSLIECQSIK